jgi:ankyrin repeat protein
MISNRSNDLEGWVGEDSTETDQFVHVNFQEYSGDGSAAEISKLMEENAELKKQLEQSKHCSHQFAQQAEENSAAVMKARGALKFMSEHPSTKSVFQPNQLSFELMAASSQGNATQVEALLEINEALSFNIIDDTKTDKHGMTALIKAARNNYLDVITLLLKAKANVDAADKSGDTALIKAVLNGHLEVVKLLLEGWANVDVADKHGWTPLMLAARNGRADMVELLLGVKANVVAVCEKDNRTALMWAARRGQPEVVELLLKANANIGAVSKHDETARDLAVRYKPNKWTEVVKFLDERKSSS